MQNWQQFYQRNKNSNHSTQYLWFRYNEMLFEKPIVHQNVSTASTGGNKSTHKR